MTELILYITITWFIFCTLLYFLMVGTAYLVLNSKFFNKWLKKEIKKELRNCK